ncbi:MAG: MFS transporter, partial [Pseudonocardiales bacterium]|nr:MFS transporter [Pseudonocardiales bacterium]
RIRDSRRAADGTTTGTPFLTSIFVAVHGATKTLYREGSAWRIVATQPRFRLYFAGSVASNFGTWLQNGAQVVLAFQLTHSVMWVGLVTGAQFVFPLILGPWAGGVVQRLGNWRTLIIAQGLSMGISATLALLQFWHVLSVHGLAIGALAMGFSFTFALPAQSVTVPALVPPAETKHAVALDSVSYNLGRALAPVFSIALFVTAGFSWVFAVNAVSFGFFVAVLLWLNPHQADTKMGRSLTDNGFRIAWQDRRILLLLLMVATVTVAADPITVLGPVVAHTLGGSADWSAAFIAALGTGHVLGSLRPSRREASLGRGTIALGLLSVAMMVFILAPWLWLSVLGAATAGLACLLAGATLRTLLLCHAGGAARQTAVMAAWAVAWAGSKPIASFADGTLAGIFGFRLTGFVLALPALVPVLVLRLRPSLAKRLLRHADFNPAS